MRTEVGTTGESVDVYLEPNPEEVETKLRVRLERFLSLSPFLNVWNDG